MLSQAVLFSKVAACARRTQSAAFLRNSSGNPTSAPPERRMSNKTAEPGNWFPDFFAAAAYGLASYPSRNLHCGDGFLELQEADTGDDHGGYKRPRRQDAGRSQLRSKDAGRSRLRSQEARRSQLQCNDWLGCRRSFHRARIALCLRRRPRRFPHSRYQSAGGNHRSEQRKSTGTAPCDPAGNHRPKHALTATMACIDPSPALGSFFMRALKNVRPGLGSGLARPTIPWAIKISLG